MGGFGFCNHVKVIFQVTNNTEKLTVFVGNFILGHTIIPKCEVGCIHLFVGSIQCIKESFVGFVLRGLCTHHLFSCCSCIGYFSHNESLVLIRTASPQENKDVSLVSSTTSSPSSAMLQRMYLNAKTTMHSWMTTVQIVGEGSRAA